jgi:predicted DNA-binding transcriptional regulator YafY
MSVDYDSSDESEIVIKVLMFGPNMRVLEPQSVIDEIKKRVTRQKQLFEHLWL